MCKVILREKEDIESALRRLKKKVDGEGILSDFRNRESYEKPSVKRNKKHIAAIKRAKKRNQKVKTKNHNFRFNRDKTEKIPMEPRGQGNRRKKSFKPRTQI